MKISNRKFLSFSHSASTLSEEKFLRFTKELKSYIKNISEMKSLEENGKDYLKALFRSTGYENYKIEADQKVDLAIFEHEKNSEVFFETKLPNSSEMISDSNFQKKSFAQICYYADKYGTSSLKHLIITDYKNLYLLKTSEIEKIDFPKYRKSAKTSKVYEDFIQNTEIPDLKFTKVDFSELEISKIEEVEKNLYSKEEKVFEFKRKLTAIYKLFSPENLLELNFGKDMNSLDTGFYHELLHIFGVEERMDDGIQKILRKKSDNREVGSILELTFSELGDFRVKHENDFFETAFELNIIWLNRILFLKLLEARLVFMHPNFKPFMNSETLSDFRQLENLFFEIMAKEISDRKRGLEKFSEIPYMNSSLFEKKEIEKENIFIRDLDSNLEMELFENSILGSGKIKTLDYLFQFLNSYDFGSNKFQEVAPIDKTLIKSSVLGLIFEKVNGYKDGSHFTPSFITQKLANDSLNRFSGDLKKIKILDPAVGSGHILVSAMNELVVRQTDLEDEFGEKREIKVENDEIFISDEIQYISNDDGKFPSEATKIQIKMFQLKKEIIETNLFGVDVNFKSVEIARLRLWVELLKWSYYDKNGKFTTLPNLDINIKVGNSLLSQFEISEDLEKIGKEKVIKLLELNKRYFSESGEKKRETEKEILEIRKSFKTELSRKNEDKNRIRNLLDNFQIKHGNELIFELLAKYGVSESLFEEKPKRGYKKELKEIETQHEKIEFLENLPNAFEWRFEFPEALNSDGKFEGFDLIIANPPYIRQEKIKDLKPALQMKYDIFSGTADIYTYFFELGFNLLSEKGILSFIVSNKWTRAKYGKNLRKMVLDKTQILQYVDFNGVKVFDSATVDTSILSFQKSSEKEKKDFQYCTAKERKEERTEDFRYFDYDCFDYKMSDLSEESFSFANPKELEIKKKIEEVGTPLKDWDIKINYGIKTGFNEAFIISTEKRNEILENCTSSEERERTEKIIKKVLRGRDIKRYSYEWSDLWIISTFPSLNLDIENYPSLKSYLESFGKRLNQTGEKGTRKKTSNKWFETQDQIAYWKEFEKEKILQPQTAKNQSFTFDKNYFYGDVSMQFWTSDKINMKYILAFANSKVFNFYMRKIAYSFGETGTRWIPAFLLKVPVPKPKEESEKVLSNLVDEILSKKAEGFSTTELEEKIDEVVFQLYNLTKTEIEIVKKS
jgi:adenine-specific DNA-methyltransferase